MKEIADILTRFFYFEINIKYLLGRKKLFKVSQKFVSVLS